MILKERKTCIMRTENEMMNLIINYAKNDNRIRAVYMNGSRTNPNVWKDIFQDYDIVYVVTETASFLRDENWINYFGELLIIQEPDKNDQPCGIQRDFVKSYSYLMLFTDGNRIDLHIETEESMRKRFVSEKLTISLLDKDHILPAIDPPSDSDYHILMPTEAMYAGCTNNFWWCLQNVAKGIWRDELPYAKGMFERVIRDELDNMFSGGSAAGMTFKYQQEKWENILKTICRHLIGACTKIHIVPLIMNHFGTLFLQLVNCLEHLPKM